jgi:hypothetical protein
VAINRSVQAPRQIEMKEAKSAAKIASNNNKEEEC